MLSDKELIALVEGQTPWRVKQALGRGAHSTVFEVQNAVCERSALKVGRGLEREFNLARRAHHASLLRPFALFDLGEVDALAMPLIAGDDLVADVRREVTRSEVDESIAPRKTLPMAFGTDVTELGFSEYAHCGAAGEARLRRYVLQIADALEALHNENTVHLDVARHNVLVEDGRAVLLDFGLARDLLSPADTQAVGAAAYLAPELALGRASPACDWYSLGVVVFEALTGAFPFEGGGAEVLVRKQSLTAPCPSSMCGAVGAEWDALCRALLARRASARGGYKVVRRLLQNRPT